MCSRSRSLFFKHDTDRREPPTIGIFASATGQLKIYRLPARAQTTSGSANARYERAFSLLNAGGLSKLPGVNPNKRQLVYTLVDSRCTVKEVLFTQGMSFYVWLWAGDQPKRTTPVLCTGTKLS